MLELQRPLDGAGEREARAAVARGPVPPRVQSVHGASHDREGRRVAQVLVRVRVRVRGRVRVRVWVRVRLTLTLTLTLTLA